MVGGRQSGTKEPVLPPMRRMGAKAVSAGTWTVAVRESTIREPNRTPPHRGFTPPDDSASDHRVSSHFLIFVARAREIALAMGCTIPRTPTCFAAAPKLAAAWRSFSVDCAPRPSIRFALPDQGQSDRDSSPWSRRPRNRPRTSAVHRRWRRLLQWPEAASSNRR